MHPPATRDRALSLIRAGHNDCEVARRTGVARTTVRDWRRPRYTPRPSGNGRGSARSSLACPRCWHAARPMEFSPADYAELLGLYLGDGYIVRLARTHCLRIFLDSRYGEIVAEARTLLERGFCGNSVGAVERHDGRMTVLQVYSTHLPCLLPQHGPGKKHDRSIALEAWQREIVDAEPWRFLRGCIRSDGCVFVNRTGPYEYLSYDFTNRSQDILDLFCSACDRAGVEYRRYAKRVRIYRRRSVALMQAHVGVKR